jgi:hypothetical protein
VSVFHAEPHKSELLPLWEKWRAAAEDGEYLRLKDEHRRRNA